MQRQTWPTAWLFTDERMGAEVRPAIIRASRAGAGVMVRHHASRNDERAGLAAFVRAQGAVLGIARDSWLAVEVGASLVHEPDHDSEGLPFSLPVHDEAEAIAAARSAAALVFVSPIHATRTHPGSPSLGTTKAAALARMSGKPAYALGGMDPERGAALMAEGWAGWAGIDCWLRT